MAVRWENSGVSQRFDHVGAAAALCCVQIGFSLLHFIPAVFIGSIVLCADEWTATIPKSVIALEGSCVVIPCTYDHPASLNSLSNYAVWYQQPVGDEIRRKPTAPVVYHDGDSYKVDENFKDRTLLPGRRDNEKNCSLQINHVTKNDATNLYVFRIEFNHDKDKYSFIKKAASISVKAEAERPVVKWVRHGEDRVNVSCSVVHSCPSHPPAFTWSITGDMIDDSQSEELKDGQHKLTSRRRIRIGDAKQPITCTVHHHGGKTVSTSLTIAESLGNQGHEGPRFHTTNVPDTRNEQGQDVDSVHTTEVATTPVETTPTESDTTQTTGTDIGITVVVPVVATLAMGTAILVSLLLYRKYKKKQPAQSDLYLDTVPGQDQSPKLEMPDEAEEVYANCEEMKMKTHKHLDDEDIYANTEFLQEQGLTMAVIQGLGAAKDLDDDIYANM
ncbi:uncharacterized protein LOC134464981 [Engraulis encrasicolus]|uniref:uncharacterized protein LOC134464981 n=1 Tax=Engraulis encrasicolus TaxID=184585 RepID=UPI002FD468E3